MERKIGREKARKRDTRGRENREGIHVEGLTYEGEGKLNPRKQKQS